MAERNKKEKHGKIPFSSPFLNWEGKAGLKMVPGKPGYLHGLTFEGGDLELPWERSHQPGVS